MSSKVLSSSWVAALVFVTGCRFGMTPVEIPIYPKPNTPAVALVHIEIPKTWRALTPSASRVEYLAPDNKTRCYFRTMKGSNEKKECRTLAENYTSEFISSWGPGTKVADRSNYDAGIEFELHRKNPKPDGEIIWSKVECKLGVLAVASCATATTSASEPRKQCTDIVSRFEVRPAPKPGS